ncbi:MAG: biotin transporter BioY [Longimicrobiales bacterium]|nr:biotin transporter BioY [Longimicrobiales bacterium]
MTALTDAIAPASWRDRAAPRLLLDAGLVLGGSLLVALSAQLALRLPFTPVPVTGQPLAVLLVAAALGSRRGALAMALYLAEGAAGLPVFAGGGCCVPWLLGPTAGYLWSYPLVAYVVGALAERGWDRHPLTAIAAMLLGTGLIYLVALPWLAGFVGAADVLRTGLYPFVVGDLLKVVLAALLLPSAWALAGRGGRAAR